MQRKIVGLTLMMLSVFAIIGALTATSLATQTTVDTSIAEVEDQTNQLPIFGMPEMMLAEQEFVGGPMCGHGHRGGGPGGMGNIEISSEYNETVSTILNADADVQTLIAEGYNVTSIRPEITTTIEGDGTITTKASTAVVTLQNGTSGIAIIDVDVSQAKVTQITIFTKTVIDKTSS